MPVAPTRAMRLFASIVVVLAAACGGSSGSGPSDEPDAAVVSAADAAALPTCDNSHQFVVNTVQVPTSSSQASTLGLDLDGDSDNQVDNALGRILSALRLAAGLDAQQLIDESLADGGLLQLLDVQTDDLENSDCVSVQVLPGRDLDDPVDPSDNFSGDESFAIADDQLAGGLSGTIQDGKVVLGPGTASISLPLWPSAGPIRIPLTGARLEGTISAEGIMSGRLAGGIAEQDIHGIVLPALADGMNRDIENDCTGVAPQCCAPGTTTDVIVRQFDFDADCRITADELLRNVLIAALLQPDVDLIDADNGNALEPDRDGVRDSLSVGVGLTAVGASF